MFIDVLDKAKPFIYRNARPLDMARFSYLFEGGNKKDVVECLKAYENEDGGFGHGLEPDCLNELSTPLQTWVATEIIKEIEDDSLVKDILVYLDNCPYFDGNLYSGLNSVKENDYCPHGEWWSYSKDKEDSYNPSAALFGFMYKYKKDDVSKSYVLKAIKYFKEHYPLSSMHEVSCFVELAEYIRGSEIEDEEFNLLLCKQIGMMIEYDTSKWESEYVCKPSQFIKSKDSIVYKGNEDIAMFECSFIERSQKEDGTFTVNWAWENYPEEWIISRNWWKSDLIIKNLKFLKNMEKAV